MANPPPAWRLDGPRVWIGGLLRVSFQRTPQVPASAAVAPSPSYGAAPLWPADGADADLLLAIGDGEAFWIGLSTADDSPVAVRVLIDAPRRIDALTGAAPDAGLTAAPQNYLVCPPQTALDGLRVDAKRTAPFIRGSAEAGAGACERLTIIALAARKPQPPRRSPVEAGPQPMAGLGAASEAGFRPAVLPDPYGVKEWQTTAGIAVRFQLVTHAEYVRVSGQPMPPPLDQISTYRGQRYP